MPTFPTWDSTHCCCSPKISFGAGIKITGLLSALALCSPVKLSATCNVRLFRPLMLSSYNLLQRPCSEISNLFQIVFPFLPFPGFPLDTPWAWLSLLQFTPCWVPPPASLRLAAPPTKQPNLDNAANYQLLCSLQKGSIPACYFLLFQQSPMTLIARLKNNKIASYQGFKK